MNRAIVLASRKCPSRWITPVDIAFSAIGFVLDLLFFGAFSRDPHERMHPRYGIPRERVRAMKRTAQGRAELKRIREH